MCINHRLVRSLLVLLLVSTVGRGADGAYEPGFSTFFGGGAGEMIRDVEVDRSGCIYVAGTTRSADFPTTRGTFREHLDTSQGTSRWGYNSDIFVAKFRPTGELIWSTLVGGPSSEEAYGLEIDSKGFVIVKLSPNLDRVLYSTFLGGSGDDNGRAGCVGADGSLIVAGTTSGSDWPTRNAHQNKLQGPSDALVAKLSCQSSTIK